jgi:rhodanese-related sulfurtransferase
VASPDELAEFVEKAGDRLVVVDLRNPNADEEPGDVKSLAAAGLPSEGYRPHAVHLQWDRERHTMPLPDASIPKDSPIITHCGGGGRGQMAKEYLEAQGFTNVLNGGGPKEKECWKTFGHL